MDLIPASELHAPHWFAWRHEQSTRRYNPVRQFSTKELALRLSKCGSDLSKWDHSEYRWFALVGSQLVGTVSISGVSEEMGYAELGYMLAETHHRKGLGTRLVEIIIEKVFSESSLRRLIAYTSDNNLASQKLLEKVGFVREGVLREHFVIEGRPKDQLLYGLLKAEWVGLTKTGNAKTESRRPGQK